MAKGPKDLLELREDDHAAIKAVEDWIDQDQQFNNYDGQELKVTIPKKVWDHFSVRMVVRRNELYARYIKAGWKQVAIYPPGSGDREAHITLNQYAPSSSSWGGKD